MVVAGREQLADGVRIVVLVVSAGANEDSIHCVAVWVSYDRRGKRSGGILASRTRSPKVIAVQDIAHDVVAKFLPDGPARKEIGNVDGQPHQTRTAGIAEEVAIHSPYFRCISPGESLHHRTEVVLVNR